MIVNIRVKASLEAEKGTYPMSPLERNTKLAQEAIAHTVATLSRGACNVVNSKVSDSEISEMRKEIQMRWIASILSVGAIAIFASRSMQGYCKLPLGFDLSKLIVSSCLLYPGIPILNETAHAVSSRVAKSYQVGNCGEHSRVAFDYLKKIGGMRVEVILDFANDHTFVVIDRDPKSSLAKIADWGAHAVVCDPWAGECFPACKLKERLASILANHLSLPKLSLQKEDFRVSRSYDEKEMFSLFHVYAGDGLANAMCLDILLFESLNSYTKKN